MHSSFFKAKCRLLKTYILPLISVFTLVNSELRNISNDKMTLNCLIIKCLRCHLSFVIFAFTQSLLVFALCLWVEILRDGSVLKFEKFCMV